jgi:hypothetical protein
VFSLLLAAVAAIAMCVTGAMLATTAGAAGGAPTVTNGIAAFTVGDNTPAANTFDVDTLVQGGVANIDPTSLTIVTPAPAGDATSTVASSSSHGLVTTTLAVDGSGNVLATGPFSLTFGVCSPGTAAYSATDPTCSTGTLTYEPTSNQNMGDELKILGIVTEDIYEGVGIASIEPSTVPHGGTFTISNAAGATALPASEDGFTVNYADEFAAIVPVPAGLTYVPGSVQLTGGDSVTSGQATGKYCTAAGTGCDATINTGNYKTNYPYIEEELPSSIHVAGGQTVTMPTLSAQFTATGSIGTVEPVDLTEFKVDTNVATAGDVNFDGYPTNSSNGSGTPPYTPPTPLSTTTIAPATSAPAITSASSATFTEGSSGSFTVTTSGNPTPSLSETGPLPSGVTFVDNGNGTATLAGIPAAGTNGSYPITIGASNGVSPNASQSFSLTVDAAPAITSAASTTFTQGSAGTFTVTSTGNPTAAFAESGVLPSGVTFADNGDGTATLSGTPGAGSGGTYPITITASNGVSPAASQLFTLTVDAPPTITSGDSAGFAEQAHSSFTVTSTGTPTAALSESGPLPSGVTFADNGDGTATLAGTPDVGTAGSYPITITASNGVSPDASQSFTLNVASTAFAPSITSAASTTFQLGSAGSFTVTTTGEPTAAVSESGPLPSGVSFVDNGDGTATLAGTPTAQGVYPITISATNGVSPDASQSFTLTVDAAPVITSSASTTFTAGTSGSFTVTSTGTPTAALSETGSLPSGVSFVDNGGGTGTLSGTPAAGTGGTYPITFGAGNGVGSPASQSFTLTVDQAPAVTSAAAVTFLVGSRGSFTPTATGFPTATITESGPLPGGVSFRHGSLSGTPTGTGSFPVTFTASNGVSPAASQSFTLTVDQAPAITSADATTFTQSAAGSFTVTSTGTPTPTLSEFGNLPSGITFTSNGDGTGTLAGTSSQAGTFQIGFVASNGEGSNATQLFTLTIGALQITTTSLPPLTEGSPYSVQLTSSGGVPPIKWNRVGKLPKGMHLSKTGVLSGTVKTTVPTGTVTVTVKVTDSTKRTHQTATASFPLQINS